MKDTKHQSSLWRRGGPNSWCLTENHGEDGTGPYLIVMGETTAVCTAPPASRSHSEPVSSFPRKMDQICSVPASPYCLRDSKELRGVEWGQRSQWRGLRRAWVHPSRPQATVRNGQKAQTLCQRPCGVSAATETAQQQRSRQGTTPEQARREESIGPRKDPVTGTCSPTAVGPTGASSCPSEVK